MLKELIGRPSTKIKIEYKTIQRLQNIVLRQLKVNDLNKLRDRFEGQKYLNTFMQKSFAELAFERITNQSLVDWEAKELHKFYKPQFGINGQTVELLISDLDNYPLIPQGNYDLGVIIFVNLDSREAFVSGYASHSELSKYAVVSDLSPVFESTYLGHLKNFEIIKPFLNINLS